MNINDKELAIFVGNKIRKYRTEMNLKQKDLGDFLNLQNNTISAYERGVVLPNITQMKKIAIFLNQPLDNFFPENSAVFKQILENDHELNNEEIDILNTIIEETMKIDEEKRKEFLHQLEILVKLHQ